MQLPDCLHSKHNKSQCIDYSIFTLITTKSHSINNGIFTLNKSHSIKRHVFTLNTNKGYSINKWQQRTMAR